MASKSDTTQMELAENVASHTILAYGYNDDAVVDLSTGKNDPELEVNLKLAKNGYVSDYRE
jgi:hypothetical protein